MLLTIFAKQATDFGCINYKGEHVDWWLMVKPNVDNKAVYLDDFVDEMGYVQDFDDYDNPLMRTVVPLYEPTTRIQSMMWNDELDGVQRDSIYGSEKGVLAIDPKTGKGFYMQHTTPNWPPALDDGEHAFWDNPDYGHHYLCISINTSQLENIAQTLLAVYPQIYQNSFAADFVADIAPSMIELFGIESELAVVNVYLESQQNRQFAIFSRQGYVNSLWNAVR